MVHSDVAVRPQRLNQSQSRNTNSQRSVLKLAGAAHQGFRCFWLIFPWLIFTPQTLCKWLHDLWYIRLLRGTPSFLPFVAWQNLFVSQKRIVMGGWWVVQKCRPVRSIRGLLSSFLPISFLHHIQPLNAWKPEFSVFSVWCVSFTMKINLFGTGRSQCLCIVEMPLDWTVKHDVLFPTTRKETALQQEVFWYVLCPSNKDRTCDGSQAFYSRCRQTCFITRGYQSAIAQCLCFIRESWRWRMTFVATRQLKQQPMSVTCKVFQACIGSLSFLSRSDCSVS